MPTLWAFVTCLFIWRGGPFRGPPQDFKQPLGVERSIQNREHAFPQRVRQRPTPVPGGCHGWAYSREAPFVFKAGGSVMCTVAAVVVVVVVAVVDVLLLLLSRSH